MSGDTESTAVPLARSGSHHSSHGENEWDLVDASQGQPADESVSSQAEEKLLEDHKSPAMVTAATEKGSAVMGPVDEQRPEKDDALAASDDHETRAHVGDDLSSHMSHPNWLSATNNEDEVDGAADEKSFEVGDVSHKCSNCQTIIVGVRYKCLYCSNPAVHLCPSCEEDQIHNELHPLIKIRRPQQCPDDGTIAKEMRSTRLEVIRPVGAAPGTTMTPGEVFFAGWSLKYSGTAMLRSCILAFAGGNNMGYSESDKPARLPPMRPNAQTELMVELKAPMALGPHRAIFRLRSEKGTLFGPVMACEINVHAKP